MIGRQLRAVRNATDRAEVERARRVAGDADSAPKRAAWLDGNIPKGLATAILVEIDEQWVGTARAYLNMDDRDG